jgi:serine protease Do
MNVNWQTLSKRTPTLAAGGVLLIAAFTLGFTRKAQSGQDPKPAPVHLAVDERPVDRTGRFTTSFAPIVKKVSPSVVKVSTAIRPKSGWSDGPSGDDTFLRRFFGEGFGSRGQQRNLHMPREHGVGSGVIVTKDGYILTNNHVVDGAEEVKVALQDGRDFTAKVVGRDPKSDVAVLKVAGSGLPFIELADSEKLEVGDVVLAIGNPFGIGQTVTMGMVSAKGRGNMGLDYEDFIQTDAAINPGNSGGALVDAEGRLVGVNTAILSRSGGNQGIGFAIPTNLAKSVMESLVQDGRVERGYLGVIIQDVTPALAKEFRLSERGGALVGDVEPKGPAAKAGVKSGDVVLEFNGKAVRDSRQLKLQVAQTKPGLTVPVKVLREGSTRTLEVTLKELPSSDKIARAERPQAQDTGTLNGVGVADLDRRTRAELGVPAHVNGAVVTEVEPDSAAHEAGLQPGDVILEINRQPVRNAQQAVQLTENPKDKTTLLRIWSKGASHYLVVDETKAG